MLRKLATFATLTYRPLFLLSSFKNPYGLPSLIQTLSVLSPTQPLRTSRRHIAPLPKNTTLIKIQIQRHRKYSSKPNSNPSLTSEPMRHWSMMTSDASSIASKEQHLHAHMGSIRTLSMSSTMISSKTRAEPTTILSPQVPRERERVIILLERSPLISQMRLRAVLLVKMI